MSAQHPLPLEYIINHLFLPPRLPQASDASLDNDSVLCELVLRNAQTFADTFSPDSARWGPIVRMLKNLQATYAITSLDKLKLRDLLPSMTQGDTLVIPVRTQNACVFARRLENKTIYESFEIDPPNEQVMATKGRLVRWFPGPAIEVTDTETQSDFLKELAAFLADMDAVTIESAPSTQKAGSKVFENRETADPQYITQLLTSILHGLPNSQPADIERVEKRVRNEILISMQANEPWRRSPLWLIIRVALQTTLRRGRAGHDGQAEYKAFIIFLLADVILSADNCESLSTDLLVCVQNKIVRRLRKCSDAVSSKLLDKATEAITKAKDIIDARGGELRRQQAASPPWSPESLNVSHDTEISLLSSKDYIARRLQQPAASGAKPAFQPSETIRLHDDDFLHPEKVSAALKGDPFVALADIESFALKRLDAWVDTNDSNTSACVALGECINHYALSARSQYKQNPEDVSVMILTIFLLWWALDRMAIKQHPSLADYSPEINEAIFDPILVRKNDSIEALIHLRSYICTRRSGAYRGSVFDDTQSSSSFSIRYFNHSPTLKELKRTIEAEAQAEREEKRKQFYQMKDEYNKLRAKAASKEHNCWRFSHRFCKRCSLEREANRLHIYVHEWPLPDNSLFAEAAVFELQCPPAFQAWRTVTYMVLYDFCHPGLEASATTTSRAEVTLAAYPGLAAYCKSQTRITYASHTKSFEDSHYRYQHIANAEIDSILVNNGLRYALFDSEEKKWVTTGSFAGCTVESLCRFHLVKSSPYYSLQYALQGTTHSANQPIAEQAGVKPDLSVHEHIAFGTLRCGAFIQWMNILRELRARTLSFDRLEVHMLITQSALQAGTIKGDELEWHSVLKRRDFSLALLSEIDDLISSIESNWHHIYTLQTIIIIITRLLSSSVRLQGDKGIVIHRACSTLRTVRDVAFSWVNRLIKDLQHAKDDDACAIMRERVCSAAATCRATYDVDAQYLSHLLNSDNDVEIFIQCAIQVQDNTPPSKVPFELGILLSRDRRMSLQLAPRLWAKIETSRAGLDRSIRAIWEDYNSGSDWKVLSSPNDRWLTSTIPDASAALPCTIHYNMLNGTLLIDGKPLGRLPSSIVSHPTYTRLLGNKILDIVPSTLPTMDFATRRAIFDSNLFLHFQLPERDGGLIIQAKVGAEIFELIPHTTFGDGSKRDLDFPLSFVTGYAHWLQLLPTSDLPRVTFHPLEFKWKPSTDSWCLSISPKSGGGSMKKGGAFLVDIRSGTFAMISRRLAPLEVPSQMHVLFDTEETLSVILPRYKMTFFVNDNVELECSTIRDMVVDFNQSSGTMFGLANQLVLRDKHPSKTRVAAPGSRCVVVPFGKLSFKLIHHHNHVTITLDGAQTIKYFVYQIDTTLGRLTGSTLLSDIYKVYLHACTSSPLADDLTGRTGTEEALCELESARYLSFQNLQPEEAALLCDIANLTPCLEWYPKHLKMMQTVTWNNLTPLAQHWAFAPRVNDILRFQNELSSLGMGIHVHGQTILDDHLLSRHEFRTSGLYPQEKKPLPSIFDVAYPLTDNSGRACGREINILATNVSALTYHVAPLMHTVLDLWDRLVKIGVLLNSQPDETNLYRNFLSPNLSDVFLVLYKLCRQSEPPFHRVAFILATMVYTSVNVQDLMPTLLSFARLQEFRLIDPPSSEEFNLSFGHSLNRQTLIELLQRYTLEPPDDQPAQHDKESRDHYAARRKEHWLPITRQQIEKVCLTLEQQWPCVKPTIPRDSGFYLLDIKSSELETEIDLLFLRWFNNRNLFAFIGRVQTILERVHAPSSSPVPQALASYQAPSLQCGNDRLECKRHLPATFDDLLPLYEPSVMSLSRITVTIKTPNAPVMATIANDDVPKLQSLVEQLKLDSKTLHRVYGDALQYSLDNYLSGRDEAASPYSSLLFLVNDYELRRREFEHMHEGMRISLSPRTSLEFAISQAGQWPIPTLRTLLGLLSKDKLGISVPVVWRKGIIALAQQLVKLQHSRRALILKISGREEDLVKELNNAVDPTNISFNDPEWLLIQVDGNFTVRSVQSSVAQEMISPRSGRNTLTQLNMGEGKSAVIVPLVSSALADGTRLVRVVTLKPLVNQMFDLLVRKLSGLANRRVFYLPFSRDFKPLLSCLQQLQSLYEACLRERGVLLIQPEHILSFRLMGVDLAAGMHGIAAKALIESHRWLTSMSRDILDESDEILRVTYQLVYTSGLQEPMDNHPDRWNIVQEIMGYAHKHAVELIRVFPDGLEVQEMGGIGCPVIRILDIEAGEALVDSVVSEVLSSDRFKLLPLHIRTAASDFVRCKSGSASGLKMLRSFLVNPSTWKHLLLYRGFLGHGLLRFILQEKRWRVDYGLDPTRTLLAVPYRAKDLPSIRADFGHPDVALALTCLSYYYGGLTEKQLDLCFELLFKLDDPPLEYDHWVSDVMDQIPPSFRDIKGINLDDQNQRKTELGPRFRKNKAVVNFYLSNVVFPRYAKQFPKKISTSSWDLAETKVQVTTGFSGTNDNQYLLPTSISQHDTVSEDDPFGQLGTNAKVLSILLGPENDKYYCLLGSDGHNPTGSDFLDLLIKQTPVVRVLLDVGAQMLDMQSAELVSKWLSLVPELHAIVFFNNADEMVVMTRDQHVEKFVSSQYNKQLDLCAVYLDDAHTRGTDLKLPNDFRAVVTLGPKLTKDRLVQGCMRMRQLGQGQSVIFFAPLEVDRSIRSCHLSPLVPSAEVTSADILRWAIWQTCEQIEHYLPHWAQQGVEYKRRHDAWTLHESDPSAPGALEKLHSSWEEPDARTLNEMYEAPPNLYTKSSHPAFELSDLKKRLDDLGVTHLGDYKTDEEQEREISQEAELERQRELPPKVEPALSSLYDGVESLVKSGVFEPALPSSPFIPLFSPLNKTTEWSTALFSTKDFAQTVKGGASVGDFLRPVNWILSVPRRKVLVVLSPFEVNKLLSEIWMSEYVHLHIYSPRVNRNMKTLEDLRFFTVPPLPASTPDSLAFITGPMLQLNLWAGQLYLKNFEMYQQLCHVLGLVGGEASGARMWDSYGFVKPENRTGAMKEQCQLTESPIVLLKELFSLRRKGMGYEPTHMGKILNAKPLELKDFEH